MLSFALRVAQLATCAAIVAAQGIIVIPVNPPNNHVFGSSLRMSRAAVNNTASNTTVYTTVDQGSASTTGRYTADITYGGANYVVQLDTGSSDFVLASAACVNCVKGQTEYPDTGINTGCQAATTYGSAKTSYNVYLDTATLAGASSIGQTVACGAMTTEGGTFRTKTASGLLGLAYAQLSEIYETCPGHYLPVTDQLVKEGVIDNAFGMCFKMDQSGGVLALGCAQVEGLTFTPVDGDAGYYQVKVTSLTYGDQAISLSGTYDPPILDSGTTLLMLPNAMYNSVLSLVCAQLAPLLDSSGFTCDETTLNNNALPLTSDIVASFPNITITMTDGATLVVQPQSYWVNLGGGDYQFGIQSGGSQFIIGDVALQGHYLFFDKGNYQVGILVAPDCDTGAATLTGTCSGAVVASDNSAASSCAPVSFAAALVAAIAAIVLMP